MQNIQVDQGYDHLFTVKSLGQSRGLALFLMDDLQVNVLFSDNWMIDVDEIIGRVKVFMTFVYGDPVLERREKIWECLTRFVTVRYGLWFMVGDFNEITGHNEKEGGRERFDSSFLPFKQMLSDCEMLEFPFTRNMLSWVGIRGRSTVRCWLDWAGGNKDWHEKFSHSSVRYLRLLGTDHHPVLTNILDKPISAKKNSNLKNERGVEILGLKQ